jgi:hypothetical protein
LAQGKEKEVTLYLKSTANATEIIENMRAQMAQSVQCVAPVIEQMQKQMAEQAEHMAPVFQQIQEQMAKQSELVAVALQGVADTSMASLHGGLYETQALVLEAARQDSEIEDHHIRVDEAIIDQLSIIMNRLDKLENKSIQSNPELESLKAELKAQREFIDEHKETFQDIALLRQKGWQAIIEKMEERKGSKDGR